MRKTINYTLGIFDIAFAFVLFAGVYTLIQTVQTWLNSFIPVNSEFASLIHLGLMVGHFVILGGPYFTATFYIYMRYLLFTRK